MVGLNHFSINKDFKPFVNSFKKLGKATPKGLQKALIITVAEKIEGLKKEPRPQSSRAEPVPKKVTLPPLIEFRKLSFSMQKGASGQIRLMYLINVEMQTVMPMFIYSHEQYAKRPADSELTKIIEEAV